MTLLESGYFVRIAGSRVWIRNRCEIVWLDVSRDWHAIIKHPRRAFLRYPAGAIRRRIYEADKTFIIVVSLDEPTAHNSLCGARVQVYRWFPREWNSRHRSGLTTNPEVVSHSFQAESGAIIRADRLSTVLYDTQICGRLVAGRASRSVIRVASDWEFDTTQHLDTATPGAEQPAVEELQAFLFGGESVDAAIQLDDATVGVSSHRILAYRPDGDGPALQTAHRANVTDITLATSGATTAGYRAVRFGVYTLILGAAGSLIELDSIMEPVSAPTGMGMGSAVALLNLVVRLIGYFDEVLLFASLATAAVTLFFIARYLNSRNRVLEITRAGGEPLRIPLTTHNQAAVDHLAAPLTSPDEPEAD